jgi:hypothetical protein
MPVHEIVIRIGRVFAEHDHANTRLFRPGNNFLDRAAAIVRKGGMGVQHRPYIVVVANEPHVATLRFKSFNRFVDGLQSVRLQAIECINGASRQ